MTRVYEAKWVWRRIARYCGDWFWILHVELDSEIGDACRAFDSWIEWPRTEHTEPPPPPKTD